MKTITDELFKLKDEKYADFSFKLAPTLKREDFIGVRAPALKGYYKKIKNEPYVKEFLDELPHHYYDENMLHSICLSDIKDYDEALTRVNQFLPYVDNWAACDTLKPKAFAKNKEKLIKEIKKWVKSKKTYTIRFGIEMLMNFYLDEDFKEEYLDIVSPIRSEEYYVNMMIAWYYATALAKQYDMVIKDIENHKLDKWTHNKAIQKAIESYRITDEQKVYLRSLKIV